MHTQYCVQNKSLDLCFSKHKRGIEIYKYGKVDRDLEYEKERQKLIEDRGYTVIRSNPDAPVFNIYRLINKIRTHIKQPTIKLTKSSLIDDLSKDLLETAIELKSKCKKEGSNLIKKIVKNVLPEYKQ